MQLRGVGSALGGPSSRTGSRLVHKLLTVLTTLLVVSSIVIAPVSATAHGPISSQQADLAAGTGTSASAAGAQSVPSVNASGALPRTITATLVVQTIDAGDSDGLAVHKRVASERINGSVQYYRDRTRVTSQRAFLNQSVAVLTLARLAGTAEEDAALRASRLLADASNRTAALAIEDAQRALDRVEANDGHPGNVSRVEAAIDNAERAYERGQSARAEQGTANQTMQNRARWACRHAIAYWRIVRARFCMAWLAVPCSARVASPRS